jgi:hypothetical protein
MANINQKLQQYKLSCLKSLNLCYIQHSILSIQSLGINVQMLKNVNKKLIILRLMFIRMAYSEVTLFLFSFTKFIFFEKLFLCIRPNKNELHSSSVDLRINPNDQKYNMLSIINYCMLQKRCK